MSSVTLLNDAANVVLKVYSGSCPQLTETGEYLSIPKEFLPPDYENCGMQKSSHDGIFWLLYRGRRFDNRFFCSHCKSLLNGTGSNVVAHIATHRRKSTVTLQQRVNAFFLFLVRHQIGLTVVRDPLVRIFSPDISYLQVMSLVEDSVRDVRQMIAADLTNKELFLMIDGWSDQSLRRYIGVVMGYYSPERGNMVLHFLDLYTKDGKDHTAASQCEAISDILRRYNIPSHRISCLASDSASVNTCIAEEMGLPWCPCVVHLWNLVVNNFLQNSPSHLDDVLKRINNLRKKTRWVEFLAQRSMVRNITGYTPTRWCSACECLESFYEVRTIVLEYQRAGGKPKFEQEDIDLIEEVGDVLKRFTEVNTLLMNADNREGLATVFEVINAIYMALKELEQVKGAFQHAYKSAAKDIENRFFNLSSRFCCRLIFSGILNVEHSIPKWIDRQLDAIVGIMADELELFVGATPPGSPREPTTNRYAANRSLVDMIEDSPITSETSSIVYDEITQFLKYRKKLGKRRFTAFWAGCEKFRHLKMMAQKLRAYPTNTVPLERCFSKARRILSWCRMRMSTETVRQLCVLSINEPITKRVLGLADVPLDDISTDCARDEDMEEIFSDDETE